jgi:hypothetical protein
MSDPTSPFPTFNETEFVGSVRVFEGTSVPVPPGTKARYVPGCSMRRGGPGRGWWLVTAALVGTALLGG